MESKEEENLIDEKYINLGFKGKGSFSKVYLVKDKTNNQEYAMRVLKENNPSFNEEVEIHKKITLLKHPNIINLISFGQKDLNINNKIEKNKQYMILDYASKSELYFYLDYPEEKLPEKYAKVIFYKILQGVKAMHDKNICHRDLKMNNIVLDEKFNPKICDFGYAIEINLNINNGIIKGTAGTEAYAAPEILYGKSYNGFKVDIFSLGVILFILVNKKLGFDSAQITDTLYKCICRVPKAKPNDTNVIQGRNYGKYWEKVKIHDISEEFKDLYIRMVQYKPEERFKDISEIMAHPWFKEILSKDEFNNLSISKDLEKEIYEEFLKREVIVNSKNESLDTDNGNEEDIPSLPCKGIGDIKHFASDLVLKYAKTGINMKDFIKINGNIKPCHLMNLFVDEIEKYYGKIYSIDDSKLKFDITFPKQEEEDDEDDNEDLEIIEELENLKKLDVIKKRECVIEVKCYESENGGYIIKFQKKSGEIEDYCKNLKDIIQKLKNIL